MYSSKYCIPSTPKQTAIKIKIVRDGEKNLVQRLSTCDVNLPLNKNAVNKITVTAEDSYGNPASQELAITQVSLDAIVVSKVTAERLSVEEVEKLVNEGVIDLDDPENYNVSTFDIVLTIDKQPILSRYPRQGPRSSK